MTASESHEQTCWNCIPFDIKQQIYSAVEQGDFEINLPYKIKNPEDINMLNRLGYHVFFNKTTNTHKICW